MSLLLLESLEDRVPTEDVAYELRKQRAVFLRILFSPGIIGPSGSESISRLLAMEERFRAEYDALHALIVLLHGSRCE